VLHLLKMILKATGKQGVPQGGVISPLLANLYLNEVDRMLEKAKEVTCNGKYTYLEYVRFADDMVILVDGFSGMPGCCGQQRLREELAKLQVEINEDKSRIVDLAKGESFGFLGFEFRRVRSLKGVWRPHYTPKLKSVRRCLRKLKVSLPTLSVPTVDRVVHLINPILRGWVNYFAIGFSSRCFGYIRETGWRRSSGGI
jgi:RNA-directed DNA polymerase